MSRNTHYITLVLLVIEKGPPLNTSYKLMQLLEWKFNFLNSKEILEEIEKEKYAEYRIENGVHHYDLSNPGELFIEVNRKSSFEFLGSHHPEQCSFLDALFT